MAKKKSLMYEIKGKRVRTWNPFVGCLHDCIYCYAREQAKRRKNKCERCYNFEPHRHLERFDEIFKPGEIVFVCSMGDFAFAYDYDQEEIIKNILRNPETTFYLQSKNPMLAFEGDYPKNLVIGTTIETNRLTNHISKAPYPIERAEALQDLHHKRKYVTMEPIMDFDLDVLVRWLKAIAPEFVYVGYINPLWKAKKLQMPEPPLEKTEQLIEELSKFTEVRRKTIRKAYYE